MDLTVTVYYNTWTATPLSVFDDFDVLFAVLASSLLLSIWCYISMQFSVCMMCFNVLSFLTSFTLVMKTSSLQLPSLAVTLSTKSMIQSAPKTRHFYFKNFLGRGTSPTGGGHPAPPAPTPWRLDLRAFGAHSRTPTTRKVWLRA